jgi:IclR helix-turn-helix domain
MDLTFFYPRSQQALFTDREYYLSLLDLTRQALLAGRSQHLAILGPRRIGKTLLTKEFIRRTLASADGTCVPVYLDCQRAPLSPELFATHYSGTVLAWLLGRGGERTAPFHDLTFQLKEAAPLGAKIVDYFYELDRVFRNSPVDQRALLDRAFELPEFLAQMLDRRFMLFFDEFPELNALSNYPQIGRVMDLLRAVLQTQERVAYIASGSAIGMMQAIFYDPASPLAVHFRAEMLPPLTREDSYALIEKHLAGVIGPVSEGLRLTIFRWTYGHPFYIGAICERLIEQVRLDGAELTEASVAQAFALETLWQNGRIANLCRYTMEKSLAHARGETLLQLILQILAGEEGGLTLTEVAGRLRRPSGQTRVLLQRLAEADMVAQQGALYDYRDPVMKIWAAYYYQGLELPAIPRQQILDQLVAEISQRYQRVSSELGLARESQVRELMRCFAGQVVSGALFGLPGEISLPAFRSVRAHDQQGVEIDIVAEDGESWAAEIKWQNQPATRKDLQTFWEKVAHLPPVHPRRLWFIARAGFRDSAIRFARERGIAFSSQQDLQRLAELLGGRFAR